MGLPYFILRSISAFLAFILGVFVFLKNPRSPTNRSFTLLCVETLWWQACWLATYFLRTGTQFNTCAKISYSLILFLPFTYYHFVTQFLNLKKEIVWVRYSYLVSAFWVILLWFSNLFISGHRHFSWGYYARAGLLHPIYLLFGSIATIRTILLLKKSIADSSQSVMIRNRNRFVFLATCLYCVASIEYSINYGFDIYPIGVFFILSSFSVIAYAILRYHIMDINIVIKRTVLYTVLTTVVIGIYIGVIFLSEYLFQATIGYSSLLARIIAGFIIAVTFLPFRQRIELFIDKVFFRTNYDYQKTLLTFSQSLSSILDLRMLLDLIIRVTTSTLKINKASVMLLNKDTGDYFVTSHIGLPNTCRNWKFNMDSKLISWLATEKRIAMRSGFYKKPLSLLHFRIIAEMRLLRSAVSIPLFYKQELVGVMNIGEKLSGEPYTSQDMELLDTLGSESAIAISNANLYNTLEKTYLQTIQALTQAIEAKDRYTRGHSERVTKLAIDIAKELNVSREDIETLQYASILHDIGKIAIEEDILNKPGKLTEAEYEHIKTHSTKGEDIISPIAFLGKIKPVIRHHHERFDGKGYPDGLKGNDIPLLARILCVADAFDALISERPYRVFKMSDEEAIAEIQRCAGTQFDPEVAQALIKIHKSKRTTNPTA